jgi:pimeloyl-ACP methyl ester carboxylesterase
VADFEALTIATPNLRIAARAHGPADAPPIVALHGWLDNAASFDRLAPLLPEFRVIALDLPGHGDSEHLPPGASYLFVDQVALVHAATEALGLRRYRLLGHSLGAAIASVLAGTFPERIEKLALVEGLGPLADPAEAQPERLAKALRAEAEKDGRKPPVHPTVAAAIARLTKATAIPEHAAAVIAARGLEEVEGGVSWKSDPRLRHPSRTRYTEDAVLAFLRRITCPVLVVRGSQGSPFAPTPKSPRFLALAEARLAECPGGHHVHLEAPEAVAAELRPFFAQAS